MTPDAEIMLPSAAQIRRAVEQYLRHAYPGEPPPGVREQFLPPEDADVRQWLLGEAIEREPCDVPPEMVHSFGLRAGNCRYPFMKIRISRPPGRDFFVFHVDAHDEVLHARPGSEDEPKLAQLKHFNADLARRIHRAWEGCGLLTEHAYLRREISRARDRPRAEQRE